MEFIAAKCPNCAGELRLPDDRKKAKCMYCGFDILIREVATGIGPNVEKLRHLAFSAEEEGNSVDAYEYFKRILEHEPDNFDALAGKAIAAENMASFNSETSRFDGPPRTLLGLEKVIQRYPEERRELLKKNTASRIFKHCRQASAFASKLDPHSEASLKWLEKQERFRVGVLRKKERSEARVAQANAKTDWATIAGGLIGVIILFVVAAICCVR
jgi:DNA-directed RNA polymerase subunit RPC12/RpoP